MIAELTAGDDIPDFGRAADDYARHRQGFPPRLFDELATLGIGLPGQRVLDIGTGTGLMARAMAGRGCEVTALDPSERMIATAIEEAEAAALDIGHLIASAEHTGLPDAAFDVITAATCWHWFDREAAARECRRLLAPGGRLVIAPQDWLTRPGNVIEATLATIQRHSPPPKGRQWTFQYPDWLLELVAQGFGDYRAVAFPAMLRHSQQAWVGRIVASAHIGPKLPPEGVAAFTADFARVLADGFPDPMDVEHRIFALVLNRE
ncbi:MAG: methyltransferase domain-containing protein [Pseudomonadota bacterium]